MKSNLILSACLGLLVIWSATAAKEKAPDLDTIQARYKGKWPITLTFLKSTHSKKYGQERFHKEYHAYQFPGVFRFDQDSL